MNSPVSMSNVDGVAVVTVDNAPVNALSHAVRSGIVESFESAEGDDSVQAVVLICAGRTFIAGADIKEFGKPIQTPHLREMHEVMDACKKPSVAAIHGTALGGGLETALCCNYRVAVTAAKLGLPESKLGLLPGAGGTQRLPRLVGAEQALDMMVSGDPVSAVNAESLGIVDRIVDGDSLEAAAVEFAKRCAAENDEHPRVRDRDADAVNEGLFNDYRQRMARRTRGFEAPERIVLCVEAAVSKPFAEGMTFEREQFEQCMASPQSAAMRHLFFAERAVVKVPGIGKDVQPMSLDTVGIVGAGTMGAGIALACMNVGLPTTMIDNSVEGLQRGEATIQKLLDAQVAKGRISDADRSERLKLLSTSQDYTALGDVDLVIEAAFESMDVKREIFGTLEKVCKQGAMLATNTSTLDIDPIAASTSRPEQVIGLHFFSPANVMRLLEIVRGGKTSDETIVSSLAFAKRIAKIGVVVGNCFGFVGNRMLYSYGRENQFMLLEGAPPEAIDKALTDWGMAMGPNAVGDLAGLDVGYRVRQERTDLPDDPRYYRVADLLAEQGRYGQKTSAGIYRYEEGSRKPIPDPEVQQAIRTEAERLGVEQRDIGADEIVERCIYGLVVEGARILEEGFAARSSDIDVVWCNGYGFPRYRGGPMQYADQVGLATVLDAIDRIARQSGTDYWQAPKLLVELAKSGGTFAEFTGKT